MKKRNPASGKVSEPLQAPIVIRSCSRMKHSPDHSFVNFLYVLLFAASCGCALWQHGDVRLTSILMGAAPLAYLILFIPYRIFSGLWRSILNGLYFSGVLLWGIFRMRSVEPDLVLVECLSCACLVFLAGGKSKDRGYLYFISIFLLIYGALIPRMAYLYFGAAAFACLLWILFLQRSRALGGTGVCCREKKIRFIPRILPCVVLLLLSGCLFRYIFAWMPLKDNDVPGYFQTSFLTERNDAEIVPELRKWFQFKTVRNVKVDPEKADLSGTDLKTKTPPSEEGKEGKPVKMPESGESALLEGDGAGSSSPPGRDLLFYVKCPVMLYHLVRLYDAYDGRSWKESNALKRRRVRLDTLQDFVTVEQQYTVVKMNTLNLCSGFEALDLYAFVGEQKTMPEQIRRKPPCRFYLNKFPPLPYRYVANVQIRNRTLDENYRKARQERFPGEAPEEGSGSKKKKKNTSDPYWTENISPYYYRLLPRKRISKRVYALAKKITENHTSDYAKAIALRDYLRQHYSYTLTESKKVPAGKEACDYFLFELKKGHCEYFASALAVLARCVKLPSRVATGYSPGNYNTLNKMFEVYEYHAHAWTQIYIRDMGWLTMDATPPSALDLEVLPRGLGHLRDPFGDEWKVNPPELLQSSQKVLKEIFLKNLQKVEKPRNTLIDQALLDAVKTQERVEESVRKKYKNTVKKVRQSSERKEGKLYKLRSFFRKTLQEGIRYFYCGVDFVYSAWLLLISGVLLVLLFIQMICFLVQGQCRKRRFRKILALEKEAESLLRSDPRHSVICCYKAFRLLLLCAGYDRKDNQELLAFSEELGKVSLVLGENARGLFLLFYKAEYSGSSLPEQSAEMAHSFYSAGKKLLLELAGDKLNSFPGTAPQRQRAFSRTGKKKSG